METNYLPDPGQLYPLTPIAYIVYGLLFMIPGAGLICAILLGFLAKNVNLRHYARSWVLTYAIVVIAIAIFATFMYSKGKLFRFLHNIPKAFKLLFP